MRAGDLVIVRAGHYAGLYLTTSGTATDPITFRADPGAIVDTQNPTTPDGINLEGASWIVIENFTVTGLPRAGIRAVLNNHVTIRGNTGDLNGRWGILTGFSDDLLIENNTMSRSQAEHGIYVGNSGDRPVIRRNVVWGNNANGIHMNGDLSQGGDGIISGALVEGNVIHDNGVAGGSGINCDGVQSSLIRNNLLYNNHASGISLYQIDGGQPARNNQVAQQHDRDGVRRALGDQHPEREHRERRAQQHPLQPAVVPRQHRDLRRQPARLRQRHQRHHGPLLGRRRRHAGDPGGVAQRDRPGHALDHRDARGALRQLRRQRLPPELHLAGARRGRNDRQRDGRSGRRAAAPGLGVRHRRLRVSRRRRRPSRSA